MFSKKDFENNINKGIITPEMIMACWDTIYYFHYPHYVKNNINEIQSLLLSLFKLKVVHKTKHTSPWNNEVFYNYDALYELDEFNWLYIPIIDNELEILKNNGVHIQEVSNLKERTSSAKRNLSVRLIDAVVDLIESGKYEYIPMSEKERKAECIRVLPLTNLPQIDEEFEAFFKDLIRCTYDLELIEQLEELDNEEFMEEFFTPPYICNYIVTYYFDKCLELNPYIQTDEEVFKSVGYDPPAFVYEVIDKYSLEDLKQMIIEE